VTITGNAVFDIADISPELPGNPVVIKSRDLSNTFEGTEVLRLNVMPLNNLGSGAAINFTVGPSDVEIGGNEPEENIARLMATLDEDGGTIQLRTWSLTEERFVTVIDMAPNFVTFNENKISLSNSAFFTHDDNFPEVTTDNADITLCPVTNRVVVYADVLPGIEADVDSGTFNLGSNTAQFNNAFLAGGVVTTAPTSAKGKAGDVAGAVAFDDSYIYRCTAAYTDGIADIWTKASISFGPF
jgi:hypothetical protein